MTESWAGWELPGSEHLRTVAEILQAPASPEERRQERREARRAEARRAEARDASDATDAAVFMAKINGASVSVRNPLEAASAEPFRDREAASRRRAAIEALRPLGLEDVILGGNSGAVLDPNLGILEPQRRDTRELDLQYENQRAEVKAEARRARVDHHRHNRLRYR
jgi:hypothetical protein